MPELISREQWGAAPPKRPIADLAYPVGELYVHHEGGGVVSTRPQSDEIARCQSFQRQMQQKYVDIPYSILVFPSEIGRAHV